MVNSWSSLSCRVVSVQELEGCAIWGMPVIEVWRSKKVIFCKRSMGGGADFFLDIGGGVVNEVNMV